MIHKAKKSLGQNFLKSTLALNKIVEAGEISKEDIILEIGPGKGVLTEKLLEKSDHVIAVETDYELFEFLQNKFANEINTKKFILIKGDILEFNILEILQDVLLGTLGRSDGDGQRKFSAENFRGDKKNILQNFNYKIIANIPYNITGAILKKFLTEKNQPERMILMVQNEVAKRITASDKKESILSISVKAYGEPKIIMKVPARYFSPTPKVDSAVISIKNISRKSFIKNKIDEEKFWYIIRTGFAHKRKKLSSNLKKYQGGTLINSGSNSSGSMDGRLASVHASVQIKYLGNKRAEELLFSDWIDLVKSITLPNLPLSGEEK